MNLLEFDKLYLRNDRKIIAGIDEAGRGPLAGPVSCAIAVMPFFDEIIGVNDSKKLSAKKRDELYTLITSKALYYHIELINEKTIDEINILNATKLGMEKCIESVKMPIDLVLIDAVNLDAKVHCEAIIKGDAKSYSIACASILAKVYRDRYMEEMDKLYPEYGFKKHKGYGTKFHIDKIKDIGPCEIHRKTFIKNFI